MDYFVYIIILNYNSYLDAIDCIESVLDSDYRSFSIILVDNKSTDDSRDKIEHWAHVHNNLSSFTPVSTENKNFDSIIEKHLSERVARSVLFLKCDTNNGFAAGNNLAINNLMSYESDCFVWLLNPDMTINNNSLRALTEHAFYNNGVIGSIVLDHNTKLLLKLGGCRIRKYIGGVEPITKVDDLDKVDYISGGSLFCNISNFRKLGVLPENYFLYWEETDWCTLAKRNSIALSVCEKAVCYDKGGTSINRDSFMAQYLYTLNMLNYNLKYNFYALPINYLFLIVKIFKRAVNKKYKTIPAIITAMVDFLLSRNRFSNRN